MSDPDAGELRVRMSVEPDHRHLIFEGVLSNEGIVRELRRLWGSGAYAYDRHELYDLRGITASEVDSEGVRALAAVNLELFSGQPDFRSAVVATTGLSFGFARMFQAYIGDRETNMQVFSGLEAALAWLRG